MIEVVADSHGELRYGEQGALTKRDWAEVVDREDDPFGPIGAGIVWRPKDRHVTLRTADGRLVAAAGALVVRVQAGGRAFAAVGFGSVIVTRSLRGGGLMPKLFERLLGIARTLGPERAMLFCRPELVGLYERFEFRQIAAPVWVDQPRGRIEMPEPAMWRQLRRGVHWPPGRVDLDGLPF
jgi:predicted GNAT family N-acyltransferase